MLIWNSQHEHYRGRRFIMTIQCCIAGIFLSSVPLPPFLRVCTLDRALERGQTAGHFEEPSAARLFYSFIQVEWCY